MALGIVLCFPVNYMLFVCLLQYCFVCVCVFFGCTDYPCHEWTARTQDHLAYSCDSLHLWIHVCYMFVTCLSFQCFHLFMYFYLHHFLIPYCIFIVHVCMWVCVHVHRCAHTVWRVSRRTTCRSQLSPSIMRAGTLGSKSPLPAGPSCRPIFILHWCLLKSIFLAKHFTQSDCWMYDGQELYSALGNDSSCMQGRGRLWPCFGRHSSWDSLTFS